MRLFALVVPALLVSRIDASTPPPALGRHPHDHLLQPSPSFIQKHTYGYNAYIKLSVDSAFANYKSTLDARKNARVFNAALKESRFRTLAELIDSAVPDCGFTLTTGKSVNVTGMNDMIWQNDLAHKGFQFNGPCEAWIDKTRVYHSPDCRVDHKDTPARIPIDYSVCESECIFKFYWLAVDKPGLKAYKQCVPIFTRSKSVNRPEPSVPAKGIAPLVEKFEAPNRHKSINSTTDGVDKHESKPIKRHDIIDDGSYDRSHFLNFRGNSQWPTHPPTKTLYHTAIVHYFGHADSAEPSDDKRGETMPIDENTDSLDHQHRHSYLHADPAEPQKTRRPMLPPYPFYSANTSFDHRDQVSAVDVMHEARRDGYKVSNDNTVASKPRDNTHQPTPSPTESVTRTHVQLQHHAARRRTPQPPTDHPAPILCVSAALPRGVEGPTVIQQHSEAQTSASVTHSRGPR